MKLVASAPSSSRPGRNDSCRCGSGVKYKKCCLDMDREQDLKLGKFDITELKRDMESTMAKIGRIAEKKNMGVAELQKFLSSHQNLDEIDDEFEAMIGDNLSPKDIAAELIHEAYEATTPKKRIELALKAIAAYPNCVDAFTILAEEAPSEEKSIECYREAVAAGEHELGSNFFKENEGYFWGLLETRPFMRAKFFLGQSLWGVGAHDEAIQHYQDCIRLNANDNQGVRYVLFSCLLVKNDLEAIEQLVAKYKDDAGAEWSYSKVLYYFKKFGPKSKRAEKQLLIAIKDNAHIPGFLLGKKKLPRKLPDFITMGGNDEAIAYVTDGIEAWETTPGALKWLADAI